MKDRIEIRPRQLGKTNAALQEMANLANAERTARQKAEAENAELRKKLALVIDQLIAHDSYGVPGSGFSTCLLCGGGSNPGKDDFAHKDTCLLADGELERKVADVWDEDTAKECNDLRRQLSTLAERQRWVPVEERLPDIGVRVLLSLVDGRLVSGHLEANGRGEIITRPLTAPGEIVRQWPAWEIGDRDNYFEATHWIPLPAPPTQETK